jgi:hypothetical protein
VLELVFKLPAKTVRGFFRSALLLRYTKKGTPKWHQ